MWSKKNSQRNMKEHNVVDSQEYVLEKNAKT